ncbi:DNA-directed RNA polymerase III subunit RPC5 [Bienertia sinuspersici]
MDVDEERETPVKNGEGKMDAVMEEQEDDDDHVVAEYDAYFTPSDPRTRVRVKMNSGEMKVDLLIDTVCDNYDPGFSGANIINKQGPSVQRFSAIKHLAREDTDEDILQVLQKHARLVQGLWVPKTGIRYLQSQPVESLARDFALVLFSQNPVIKDSQLKDLGSRKSVGKAVLREIAVERPSCKDWKFKEPVDVSFMKLYPKVVEQQQKLWQDTEQQVLQIIAKRSKNSTRLGSSTPSDEGASRPNNVARPVSNYSMSKETREALPKVLRKLFQTHKVCSLTDMAVTVSSHPKADVKAALIMAAAKGVDAPEKELQAAICEFTVNVHGVYVLKSSSEYPEYDPLRKLVIDLFLGSGPNAKLKKGEFLEAAKLRLQKEPTNSEFQKVISEFCVSKGGAWVLRSSDGVEK